MRLIIEFQTSDEKEQLLIKHQDKYLIEERNITEGNFLVFSDEPLPEKKIYTQVPQEEFETSKARITDLELTIAEMMAF